MGGCTELLKLLILDEELQFTHNDIFDKQQYAFTIVS